MPGLESCRFSYSRVSREIIPSDSLVGFLKEAGAKADSFEGFKPGTKPVVFAAESLWLTLFERRVQAGTHVSELFKLDVYLTSPELVTTERVRQRPGGPLKTVKKLRKNPLHAALKDAEAGHVDNRGILYVAADKIVEATKEDYGHLGTELALHIADSDAASVLDLQSQLINDAASRTHAGRSLPKPNEPDDPRKLPFMRAHFISEGARADFIDLLTPWLPVYEIGCEPYDFPRKLR